ncbi:HTH domain-containing protein [Paenibacillus naphthalenovorans]|uniref:HTH HARE-type domain-containing protein n=1 Tax=Paenibacillus naphthalenovorans TaxID=162209 RepID=A0A0U2UG80_9BACL|nr:HTH domain-containing protein [Paenibacillus naphthalenovorans]ALS22172.1 hypothetical protein IJ22_17980 [Paenibacillus naphthalenovorans]
MKKITQTQVVIDVMKQKGGYTTLLDLYREVLQVKHVNWKTKTPDATIRRIVQDQRYFFKIRPGLWALNEFKDKLPDNVINLMEHDKQNEDFKLNLHSYNQGMLITSGNMLGYKTYVPAQDQNRKYIDIPLKNLASFTKLPEFTYKEVINRIKTIDVIWLNGNTDTLFPRKIFEVENTTDFSKSLNKFNELRNFAVEMVVVAPRKKEKLFYETLKWNVYRNLKNRVQFWDYEMLEKSYLHYKNKEVSRLLF